MVNIILAVILIGAGIVLSILSKQKAKTCEQTAEKREARVAQLEQRGDGWQRDIKE